MKKGNIYYYLGLLVLGLFFCFHIARANWSAPEAMPPLLNGLYYLVTGSINQAKSSGMMVNNNGSQVGLVVATGSVAIGSLSASSMLDVSGEIKTGNTGLDCNGTTEGAWRYDDTSKAMQLCDGADWKELSWVCESGDHLSGSTCVSDFRPCAIDNGIGQQSWIATSSSWGSCVLTSCNTGYHASNGACVSDVECSSATNNTGRWLVHPNGDIAATWSGIGNVCGVGYADYVALCKPCYFTSKTCGGYTYSRGNIDPINNGGGGWAWYYICRKPAP